MALIQIADKAMNEQSRILDTVKSKLIQAKTDTTSTQGKEAIRKDINKLLTQLDNIASQTNYNGITLLQKASSDLTPSESLKFHVGENIENTISTNGNIQANSLGLGIDSLKNIASLNSVNAGVWMGKIDEALNSLNLFRSDFGSTQNQLESSVRYMTSMHTNLKKSESVIRDVDYAKEIATLSTLRILMIAGMFAMTQANKVQESMLKLLFK